MIFILPINHLVFLLALILLNGLIYQLVGKEKHLYKKDFRNPPSDLTPAEALYVLSGDVENKAVISLLYHWAQEGYLKFSEQGNDVLLMKEKDLPAEAKKYEKLFFYTIFNDYGDGNTISTKDLQGKLFGLVFKTQGDIKKQINKLDKSSALQRRLILTLVTIISTLPYMLYLSGIGLALSGSLSFSGWVISFLAGLFFALPNSFYSFTIKKWLLDGFEKNIANTIWAGIMFVSVTLILGFIGGMNGIPKSQLLITSVFAVVLSFQLGFIRRKTPAMHRLHQQIQGFRNYLSDTKKEEDSDSQVFYRHLPYALVFSTGYPWGSRFEGLIKETPSWYQGYSQTPFQPQIFARHLENQLETITQSMAAPPIPKGSIMIEAQQ